MVPITLPCWGTSACRCEATRYREMSMTSGGPTRSSPAPSPASAVRIDDVESNLHPRHDRGGFARRDAPNELSQRDQTQSKWAFCRWPSSPGSESWASSASQRNMGEVDRPSGPSSDAWRGTGELESPALIPEGLDALDRPGPIDEHTHFASLSAREPGAPATAVSACSPGRCRRRCSSRRATGCARRWSR